MKKLFATLMALAMMPGISVATTVPAAPTELKAYIQEHWDVTLEWTLPACYDDGTPLDGEAEVSAVRVFRDSREIATLQGAAVSYVDNMTQDESGLWFGFHTYRIQACVGNEWSALCYPAGIYVGEPVALCSIPWTAELKDLRPDLVGSGWMNNSGEGNECEWTGTADGIVLENDGSLREDAGLLTEPLSLFAGRDYVLEYTLSVTGEGCYGIYVADGENPGVTVQELAGIETPKSGGDSHRIEFTYLPEREGEPYLIYLPVLCVRACTPAGSGAHSMLLSALQITENKGTGISAVPAESCRYDIYVSGNTLSLKNPSGAGYRLYSVDGGLKAAGSAVFAEYVLERGIYILRIGEKCEKIMVN